MDRGEIKSKRLVWTNKARLLQKQTTKTSIVQLKSYSNQEMCLLCPLKAKRYTIYAQNSRINIDLYRKGSYSKVTTSRFTVLPINTALDTNWDNY